MATTFISTNSISTILRMSSMKGQAALSRATKEATTGRFADVGLSLGALAGRDVVLRAGLTDLGKLVDTNALVAGHLDVAQQRVGGLIDSAESFQKDLLAARGSAGGGKIVEQSATSNLQSLIGSLNVTMDGQYLFGGINTGTAPITDFAAGSATKTAVDNAFLTTFGFTQSSPLVSSITPAAMTTFLTTTLQAQFDDPAWKTTWSTATDQTARSRISTTQTVDTSVSANDQAFRDLAMTYTMLSDLGLSNLNESTFQTVVDAATVKIGGAISELAAVGAKLGTAQQQITDASSRLGVQSDIVTKQITAMEKVDPMEADVRITSLTNQIEKSQAITARIQKLNILNYL